jgi:thioredoxin 1
MARRLVVSCLTVTILLILGCDRGAQSKVATEKSTSEKNAYPIRELNDTNFDSTIEEGVVLVDFWAPWCPPCRVQLPLVKKAAELLVGKAVVAKLNVDEGKNSAARFSVSSIPTLIVFKDGKEIKKFVGVTQPDDLVAAVETALQ